jgi:hypothetical protein
MAKMVPEQHHVESDIGGALGSVDDLGDRVLEQHIQAEAENTSRSRRQ